MTTPNCKDCIYWHRHSEGSEFGDCYNPKIGTKDHKDGLTYWFSYCDDSGLYTGESFGCIHWEERL